MRYSTYIYMIFFSVFISACKNDDFSPYNELERKIISYCILDNRLENQYVSVQMTYLNENSRKVPSESRVTLSENLGNTFILKDTVIEALRDINMYYLPNYKLRRGISYKLGIVTESFDMQWSEIYIPAAPNITITRSKTFPNVQIDGMDTIYNFTINLPGNIPGINLINMYIEYEILENGKNINKRVLVPIILQFIKTTEYPPNKPIFEYDDEWISSEQNFMSVNFDSKLYVKQLDGSYKLSYPGKCILFALKRIDQNSYPQNVTIKKCYIVFYSIDPFLYDNFMKSGHDRYSVRLDESFIVNNTVSPNGDYIGIFGWMTADTTNIVLYDEMITRFGYKK